MRYCGKCGAKVSDAAVFCTECGCRLSAVESKYEIRNYQPPQSRSLNIDNIEDNRTVIITAVVAFVMVAAILSVFVYFTSFRPAAQKKFHNTVNQQSAAADIVSKTDTDKQMPKDSIEMPYIYQYSNIKYMSNVYYQAMNKNTRITLYSGDTVGNKPMIYDCNNLWYYIADVNYDNILDLIISAEYYNSNGIIIYTYIDDEIVPMFSEGIPYSSGADILTLAECNGVYGIFKHRQNSSDDFSFNLIYKDWTVDTDIYGAHYNDWIINDCIVSKSDWTSIFNSIKPIEFYDILALQSMGK